MDGLRADRRRCERWFVHRGLPHLIDGYSATEDVLTRAAPFLGLVVFAELFLTFGDRWTGWRQAIVFAAGAAALVGVLAAINRLRGRRWAQRPDDIGPLEVLAFLLGPATISAIAHPDRWVFGGVVALNLALLAVAYVVTSWGLLPMIRWSTVQLWHQLNDVATLFVKSLPLLLLFSAFIFLNAEMWQVANDFTLPYFALVAALLATIGSLFVFKSVRALAIDLARFSDWDDVRPRCEGTPVEQLVPADDDAPPDAPELGRWSRLNVGMLLFVAQGIQVLLVAVLIAGFYVVFGMLTVREGTILQWTTAAELTRSADWAVRIPLLGDEVIFTRQLVLVAGFIGLVSGLQFAVQVVTDKSYRDEFAADMTGELRQALAVRAVYHRRLVDLDD